MTLRPTLFSVILLALTTFSAAHAKDPEMCEDMVTSGKSSDEDIEACIKGEGETENIRQLMAEKRIKDAQALAKSKDGQKPGVDSYIETMQFTEADLKRAAYGKVIYAQRIEYKVREAKVKPLTTSEDLCKFLGYEKAIGETVLSAEIPPSESKANGIVIDVGYLSTSKELYKSENYYVRSFKAVTCAKTTSKDAAVKKILKEYGENVRILSDGEELNPPKKNDEKAAVNNSYRRSDYSKGTTPHSYKKPESPIQNDSSR